MKLSTTVAFCALMALPIGVTHNVWAAPAMADPLINTIENPPAPTAVATVAPTATTAPTTVPTTPPPAVTPGSTCTGFCQGSWTEAVTVGPGLPAISIRFDGKLGFADRVAPLELGLNLFQYQYHPTADNAKAGAHYFTLWRVSLGITVTKDPNTSDVTFGAYLCPLGVQIDQFALGLGLAYSADGQVQANNANFAIVVPFSYSFTLGN